MEGGEMSRGKPPHLEIGESLAGCIGKCQRAQRKEDYHARVYRRPWNQALLDWFFEQCKERPDLAWVASMIYAEGRSDLANKLLPGIERYYGRYVFDELTIEVPPAPQRPELVVDNTGGAGKECPAAKRGRGKRAAATRPAGDAA